MQQTMQRSCFWIRTNLLLGQNPHNLMAISSLLDELDTKPASCGINSCSNVMKPRRITPHANAASCSTSFTI